jgi:WD40 repeat protein
MELVHSWNGHDNIVSAVPITDDGKRISSGSFDKTAKLWDAETEKLLHTFEGHTGTVGWHDRRGPAA